MVEQKITKWSDLFYSIGGLCMIFGAFSFVFNNIYLNPFTIIFGILAGIMFLTGFCMAENERTKIQKNKLEKEKEEQKPYPDPLHDFP